MMKKLHSSKDKSKSSKLKDESTIAKDMSDKDIVSIISLLFKNQSKMQTNYDTFRKTLNKVQRNANNLYKTVKMLREKDNKAEPGIKNKAERVENNNKEIKYSKEDTKSNEFCSEADINFNVKDPEHGQPRGLRKSFERGEEVGQIQVSLESEDIGIQTEVATVNSGDVKQEYNNPPTFVNETDKLFFQLNNKMYANISKYIDEKIPPRFINVLNHERFLKYAKRYGHETGKIEDSFENILRNQMLQDVQELNQKMQFFDTQVDKMYQQDEDAYDDIYCIPEDEEEYLREYEEEKQPMNEVDHQKADSLGSSQWHEENQSPLKAYFDCKPDHNQPEEYLDDKDFKFIYNKFEKVLEKKHEIVGMIMPEEYLERLAWRNKFRKMNSTEKKKFVEKIVFREEMEIRALKMAEIKEENIKWFGETHTTENRLPNYDSGSSL